jgi:hypothetical protein
MNTRVLAIVGSDRSGSTLLDNMLGGVPGAFSAGEIRYMWERGFAEGRLCGCGRKIVDCDVWSKVIERLPPDAKDVGRMLEDLELLRTRHVLSLEIPVYRQRYRSVVSELAKRIQPLYRTLAEVSGAEVIVDSSKRPTWARMLALMPEIDLTVVHLVRDPRAVAHSRKRYKKQPDSDEERGMPQHQPVTSASFWTAWNIASERLRHEVPYLLLRYEDLLADPVGKVDEIRALVGLTRARPGLTATSVDLEPSHTVSGNPGRFKTGTVPLRVDDAWRRDQRAVDRMTVDLLTLPLARRYGYGSLRESAETAGTTPAAQESR